MYAYGRWNNSVGRNVITILHIIIAGRASSSAAINIIANISITIIISIVLVFLLFLLDEL